jgi:hypothetical protein
MRPSIIPNHFLKKRYPPSEQASGMCPPNKGEILRGDVAKWAQAVGFFLKRVSVNSIEINNTRIVSKRLYTRSKMKPGFQIVMGAYF